MLKIRLQRTGRTNDANFRIIVTPHTYKPKTGKPTEVVGNFDVKRGKYTFNTDRIKYWLSVGAQTSNTINNALINEGVIKGEKLRTLPKKKAEVKK